MQKTLGMATLGKDQLHLDLDDSGCICADVSIENSSN